MSDFSPKIPTPEQLAQNDLHAAIASHADIDQIKKIIDSGILAKEEIKKTIEEELKSIYYLGFFEDPSIVKTLGILLNLAAHAQLETSPHLRLVSEISHILGDKARFKDTDDNDIAIIKAIMDLGVLTDYHVRIAVGNWLYDTCGYNRRESEKNNAKKILASDIFPAKPLRKAALRCAGRFLEEVNVDGAKELMALAGLKKEDIMTPENQLAAIKGAKSALKDDDGRRKRAIDTVNFVGLTKDEVNFPDFKTDVANEIASILWRKHNLNEIEELTALDILTKEEIDKIALESLANVLIYNPTSSEEIGPIEHAEKIISLFGLTEEQTKTLDSPEVQEGLEQKLSHCLISGDIELANKIISLKILTTENLENCIFFGIVNTAGNELLDSTRKIISLDILTAERLKQAISQALKTHLEFRAKVSEEDEILTLDILTSEEKERAKKIIRVANQFSLYGLEKRILLNKTDEELDALEKNFDKNNNKNKEIHLQAFTVYENEDNEHILANGISKLYEYFDDDKLIWNFLGQSNRHDSLQNVPAFFSAIKFDSDQDKTKKIVRSMFEHASMGTGLQKQTLIEIMGMMNVSVWQKLQLESIVKGQQPPLSDPSNINLGRIKKELRLLQMPDFINALNNLPEEKDSLREYALALADHPTVNIDAVRNFVEDPDKFFASRTGAGETELPVDETLTALSPERAPGNWTSSDARDAIVSGTYDRLNAFSPIEVSFYSAKNRDGQISADEDEIKINNSWPLIADYQKFVDKNKDCKEIVDSNLLALRGELFLALLDNLSEQDKDHAMQHLANKGDIIIEKAVTFMIKRKKMSENEEKNTKQKLTDAKNKSLTENDPTIFWNEIYLSGWLNSANLKIIYKNISGNDNFENEDALLAHSAASKNGGQIIASYGEKIKSDILESKIDAQITFAVLAPSASDTAIAGSTTGNCDAFGHGKKAHYMINPATAQLMIYEKRKNNSEKRLIGQATLVDGKNIWDNSETRQSFFEALKESGKIGDALTKIDSRSDLLKKLQTLLVSYAQANNVITMDSLEVPPNIRETRYTPREMFDLCQQGFEKLGRVDTRYQATVQAGTQYSYFDKDSGLPTNKNTDVSTAPLAYTDNTRQESILIQRGTTQIMRENVGIRKLKPTDAFVVALMEEIAFRRSGGDKYITGYLPITQEVWTSTVEAEHRRHTPLSFISHSEQGVPNGYLLAYTRSETEIYITDTATTGTEKGVGGGLLLTLMGAVAKDKKLKPVSITMDCRGSTSALAIAKNKKMIEGMVFENDESGSVRYEVTGPTPEEIEGDNLYQFEFKIKI